MTPSDAEPDKTLAVPLVQSIAQNPQVVPIAAAPPPVVAAPKSPYTYGGYASWYDAEIHGYLVLSFFGQRVTFIGGSFDCFSPSALGVCLEEHSIKAAKADILFPIADFGAPGSKSVGKLLLRIIRYARANPGLPVFVGCKAGKGRTGTVLSALVKISDLPAKTDPIAYVRANYVKYAVETKKQEDLVAALDRRKLRWLIALQSFIPKFFFRRK